MPALILLVLVAFARPAFAHEGGVRRTLLLEAGVDHRLHVVVHLEISGPRRRTWVAWADLDRNGNLSEKERSRLDLELAARALDGIRLWVDSSTVTLEGTRSALRMSPQGPEGLMVHGSAELSGQARTVRVRTEEGGDPLELRVRPGLRPVRSASRGKVEGGGLRLALSRPDEVQYELAREGPGQKPFRRDGLKPHGPPTSSSPPTER